MRNWLIFTLIGTTALLAAAIDDAVAALKRSHAYLLQVMTPDGKGYLPMAEAEVQTALVQATIALRKPDDLEHMKAQAKAAWHAIEPGRIKEGPGRNFGVKKAA